MNTQTTTFQEPVEGQTPVSGIKIERNDDQILAYNRFGELIYIVELPYLVEGILFNRWIGNLTNQEIVDILVTIQRPFFKTRQCTMILGDTQKVTCAWDGVHDWLKEVHMPLLHEYGLIANVLVLTENVFGQLSAEFYNLNMEGADFPNDIYGTVEDALNWLRSLQKN